MSDETKDPVYHVWRSMDVGEHIYAPYLRIDHAAELADLMNRIEAHRLEKLGFAYDRSIGDHYYIKPVDKGDVNV